MMPIRKVEHIDALIIVEGEVVYDDFVNKLNLRIDHFANQLAQRKGRKTDSKVSATSATPPEAS
ncbi:MAG: hypothetical protein ACP5F6_04990 [Microbacter sp.]